MDSTSEQSPTDCGDIYQSIFRSIAAGIVITDSVSQRFTKVNPAICRMLGYTEQELLRLGFPDILVEGSADTTVPPPTAQGTESLTLASEIRCRRKDGTFFYADIQSSILSPDGKPQVLSYISDVSARTQSRELLHKREQEYRLMVENQTDLIVRVDKEGNFEFVSPSYCRMFGKRPEELLGRSFVPLVHEEDRELTLQAMKDLYRPPYHCLLEQRAWTVDGWRWLQWKDTSLLNAKGEVEAIYGIGRDITAQKQVMADLSTAKETIQRAEQRFRTIYDSTSEALMIADTNGFLDCNLAAIELFGVQDRITFCSLHPADLSPPQQWDGSHSKATADQHLQTALERGKHRFEWLHKRQDSGEDFPAEVILTAMTLNNRKVLHASVREISERKQFESELIKAKDAAEASNRAKNVFLATMSHELRTPLNPILGFSSMLAEAENLDDEQRDWLRFISARAADLLQLIEDILNISRIEAGRLTIEPIPVDVGLLIEESYKLFEKPCSDKGLKLSYKVDSKLRDPRLLDPKRLRQILLNTVGNAVKFTDAGAITISATLEESDGKNGNTPQLHLCVSDTGIGVPIDQHDLIFAPFQQLEPGHSRIHEGAGLGLTICKRLTELMQGSIRIDKEYTDGTRFDIRVPAPIARSETPTRPDEAPAAQAMQEGAKQSALLLEDDESNVYLMSSMLKRLNFNVTTVGDGDAALKICEAQAFDFLFLDVKVPGKSGLEVARTLREQGNQCPIIAVTAYAYESDRKACLEAGMDAWVTKPLIMSDLKKAIKDVHRAK